MSEMIVRLMAAYQLAAQNLGDEVSVADIRLHTQLEAVQLNPLLRALNGTAVTFFDSGNLKGVRGMLRLIEEPRGRGATWEELDNAVEIDGVEYTQVSVTPL